ncbi:Wadjet anti-phage system protein JetD domain-containing protein [Cellulosimicrobium sp. NPDC055967]|uniref:Wadjet anti-phage system protein JetD domain-containing protein n=1 Tax=Cellulosimicrobium sp. NPDC055967 TaxID=3345670 RepID=UPI0035D9F24A
MTARRPVPVTPADVRGRAQRLVQQRRGGWAARDDARPAVLDVPLHPPTEDDVRRDEAAARAWVDSWRAVRPADAVVWTERRWPRVGRQRVPDRVVLDGSDAIASFAGHGVHAHWRALDERSAVVRTRITAEGSGTELDGIARAIRRNTATLSTIAADDLERALDVATWLAQRPDSGLRVRQVPVRGVGTKWLERHVGLVTSFHEALTGSPTLGLAQDQNLVRVRLLDPGLLPGAPRTFGASPAELVRLALDPDAVLVLENLESLLSLPDDDPALGRALVVHGSGYALPRLRDVPWIADRPLVYWGDIDSDGLAILDDLRGWHPRVTSILMDEQTFTAHHDLWDVEARPVLREPTHLTPDERRSLDRVRAEGGRRLEQERIPWETALTAVRVAVAAATRHAGRSSGALGRI